MSEKFVFYTSIAAILGVLIVFQLNWVLVLAGFGFACLVYRRFPVRLALLLFAVFLLFAVSTQLHKMHHVTKLSGSETRLAVCFREPPKIDGDSLSGFVYDAETGEKVWLSYRIQSEEEKKAIESRMITGEIFEVTGTLKEPQAATVQNAFDFKTYLFQQGCYWQFEAEKIDHQGRSTAWWVKILRVKEQGIQVVETSFKEPFQSHALALIFGDGSQIDEALYQNYQQLGVVHLFAISGAQVSLLAFFIYAVLLRIGCTKQTSMVIVICVLPLYACMTGFTPSVNRACGMVMIYFFGQLIGRKISPLVAMCICLHAYLFFFPYQIYAVGLQLSFSICAGLILTQELFSRARFGKLGTVFTGTFVCQLFASPILLYHFYELSLIGFFVNMLYIPIFSFIYFPITIFVYLYVVVVPIHGDLLINIANRLFEWLILLSEKLSEFPYASITFGKPSELVLFLLIVSILILFIALEMRKRAYALISAGSLLLVLLFQYNQSLLSPAGEITFIDVGQGDAIFIRLPHGQGDYLIDAGGVLGFPKPAWAAEETPFDPGADIVEPFLKSKGVRELDKLILTHADEDHVGGSEALIESFEIGEIIIPIGQDEAFAERDWFVEAAEEIPINKVQAGDQLAIGTSYFEVVHPSRQAEDINGGSIVIQATMNEIDWLFTGDVGQTGEEEVLSLYPDLQVDVLKVGHHGSNTSTSKPFVEAIEPSVAVISAGRENRYGHPHQEVMTILESEQMAIFRTDQQGSVQYRYEDGEEGTVKIYPPE